MERLNSFNLDAQFSHVVVMNESISFADFYAGTMMKDGNIFVHSDLIFPLLESQNVTFVLFHFQQPILSKRKYKSKPATLSNSLNRFNFGDFIAHFWQPQQHRHIKHVQTK